MTTITTLLSGGECVGVGARNAGLTHLEGFEIDDSIAQVGRDNGFNIRTADVLQLDPTTLQVPDVLHASPVCKNASVANRSAELNEEGTKESPFDVAMGEKIAQFIDVMTPKIFTLENVYQYRNFKAFKIIKAALNRNGYMWDFDNLNAADFGVPQTRRRLILRAMRGSLLPMLPQPERWVGWYEAIEDLIPGLPESQFATWQLARLPEAIKGTILVESKNANQQYGDYMRQVDEPAMTVITDHKISHTPKAFILDCQNGAQGEGVTLRQGDEPTQTVRVPSGGRVLRAWLSQGRVVRMTPRALARFQSLPDSYILPDSPKLACTVIGNGVPPLQYQKIVGGLTQ